MISEDRSVPFADKRNMEMTDEFTVFGLGKKEG